MGFFKSCWEAFLQLSSFRPFDHSAYANQRPLDDAAVIVRPELASPGFTCSYPSLKGWKSCNTATSRDCWIRDPARRQPLFSQYDIHTDYEFETPRGVTREYWLDVDDVELSPDGYAKPTAKAFNATYPGPTIEACWGDEIVVHVRNRLATNGTTIHWHGMRQFGTNPMDGVNGVTQCPIAEGDEFTYRFNATQYGHTWYHSHYSLQYPDGVAAPLVIHGPSSANWDVDLGPWLMSDWVHDSAFAHFQVEIGGAAPNSTTSLLNGHGHFPCDTSDPLCRGGGSYFETTFAKGKRYLLRLINGSAGTSYLFSIDQHDLIVIASDLVPIVPYTTDHLMVAIGQRYTVIVAANPTSVQADGNYWIRQQTPDGCGFVEQTNDNLTGIVRYNAASTALPTSIKQQYNTTCLDEKHANLVPVVPWSVDQHPQNNVTNDTFEAGHEPIGKLGIGNYSHWELGSAPLWLDFSNPTILNLDNTTWNPNYAIIDADYSHGYVFLIITGQNLTRFLPEQGFPVAHPIHLHGHDFVILYQSSQNYNASFHPLHFKFNNPPRRDVALLHSAGFLAIAFKPDNPGVWLMHCHIAWHAGAGLALQILERQDDLVKTIGPLTETQNTCKGWDVWLQGHQGEFDQNDSGI